MYWALFMVGYMSTLTNFGENTPHLQNVLWKAPSKNGAIRLMRECRAVPGIAKVVVWNKRK